MPNIIVAFGSNLHTSTSSPRQSLEAAVKLLETRGIRCVALSRWFSSAAFPDPNDPEFVNGVGRFESLHARHDDPNVTLSILKQVEQEVGRTRADRWAPRVCDLDLICHGGAVLPDAATVRQWIARGAKGGGASPQSLVLPHPRMQDRAFVLAPLCDVAPDWRHPVLGLTAQQLLDRAPAADRAGVRPLPD